MYVMKRWHTMLPFGLLILSLCISPQTAFAETRWVVGVKTQAAVGLLGLEVEREWNGWSLLLNVGGVDRPWNFLLIGRQYLSPSRGNRAFFDIRVGTLGIGSAQGGQAFPFFGVGAGFEIRPLRILRSTAELGVGVFDVIPSFTPITRAGLFLGVAAGWSF